MMKELVLLRDAKSSWEYSVEDRNRPLTEKGMKRIIKMAKAQPSVFSNAEIFFSSPANRALHNPFIDKPSINPVERPFNNPSEGVVT